MANTSRDRYPEIYSHPAAGLSNEARLRRIYADIEDEYNLQHNIEPREAQGAPAEHLEWYGIELTPMLCRSDTRVWRSSH
jgi:hypothetical protein